MIKQKFVEVNGKVVKTPKQHVDAETDEVTVGGELLDYQEYVYFMLNKPAGVISATEDERHMTVIDLLEPADLVQEPHPVGRLDIDTEGLLLLTNDGKLTHQLISPNHHVDKCYFAEIDGLVTEEDIKAFKEGVRIENDYQTMPARLTIRSINEDEQLSQVEVTIQEGKFHQVKQMFEAVEKEVLYLKRLSMGSLTLDPKLELGKYRELTKEEIDNLKGN